MSRPYTDLLVTNEYIIREFDENIDPIELMWHRDDENRLVEASKLKTQRLNKVKETADPQSGKSSPYGSGYAPVKK
jgi:hypothetical protein